MELVRIQVLRCHFDALIDLTIGSIPIGATINFRAGGSSELLHVVLIFVKSYASHWNFGAHLWLSYWLGLVNWRLDDRLRLVSWRLDDLLLRIHGWLRPVSRRLDDFLLRIHGYTSTLWGLRIQLFKCSY
jgi:hypothetical protein